jgi:hypothetical protein
MFASLLLSRMGAPSANDVVTWRTARGASEAPVSHTQHSNHFNESHGAAGSLRRGSYDARSAFITETQGMSTEGGQQKQQSQQQQQHQTNGQARAPNVRDVIYAR